MGGVVIMLIIAVGGNFTVDEEESRWRSYPLQIDNAFATHAHTKEVEMDKYYAERWSEQVCFSFSASWVQAVLSFTIPPLYHHRTDETEMLTFWKAWVWAWTNSRGILKSLLLAIFTFEAHDF